MGVRACKPDRRTLTCARSTEGLQHNVVLIRELNANIARIMQLYKSINAAVGSVDEGQRGGV